MKSIEHAIVMNSAFAQAAIGQSSSKARIAEERLPFTVRVVRNDNALQKAVTLRHAAYARHVPAFAATLSSPEPGDHDRDSVVLLAESRLDGTPVGTMRIQTNRLRDLAVVRSVKLPAWLKNKSMAEATRLAVAQGSSGRVVKMVLCKAFYQYCLAADIEWMVIAARAPLDRQYEAALFVDLYPGEFFPLRHANNIPHRVLAFEVGTAAERWAEADHPLYKFMVQTYHPDIDLGDLDFSIGSRPLHPARLSERVAISA